MASRTTSRSYSELSRGAALIVLLACGGGSELGAGGQTLQQEPAYAGLSAASREAVAQSPVPVLLLPARFAAAAQVMAGPRWLAITWTEPEGMTLSLHATDHAAPALDEVELRRLTPAEHTVRGRPARTTSNEGIRAVTWEDDGVAYSLEVECFDVLRDARCAHPGFALDLADELVALPSTRDRGAVRTGSTAPEERGVTR